jgi:molybdopterin converting factor small subunit
MVRYWAGARAAASRDEEALDAGTVGELLTMLSDRPDLARVLRAASLLIDGEAVRREDIDHELATGSVVDVLPPFAGG